ncbi:MAG: hypothetical protein GJ680_07670 [Alteromonadaceae bacterium]|nr:hypothetical protein [Alteromonadaceae bacterium]
MNWLIKILGGFTVTEVDSAVSNGKAAGRALEQDRLASEIFERGGYATIQLSESDKIPRMKFVEPSNTQKTKSLKLSDGTVILRNSENE